MSGFAIDPRLYQPGGKQAIQHSFDNMVNKGLHTMFPNNPRVIGTSMATGAARGAFVGGVTGTAFGEGVGAVPGAIAGGDVGMVSGFISGAVRYGIGVLLWGRGH